MGVGEDRHNPLEQALPRDSGRPTKTAKVNDQTVRIPGQVISCVDPCDAVRQGTLAPDLARLAGALDLLARRS